VSNSAFAQIVGDTLEQVNRIDQVFAFG